jgi:TolA-binding protein
MGTRRKNRDVFVVGLCLASTLILASQSVFPQEKQTDKIESVAEQQDYAFAKGLYRDSLYQLAAEQFSKFLEKHRVSIRREEISFLLAECYFQIGDLKNAVRSYAAFDEDYPRSSYLTISSVRLGQAELRQNHLQAAIKSFKSVLDRNAESDAAGEAAYWIGEAFLKSNDVDRAVKYYTLAYENYPKSRLRDYALFSLGWTYQKKEQYKLAADWYAKLLAEYPQSALSSSASVELGICCFHAKDYRRTITELSRSLSSNQDTDKKGEAAYLIAESHDMLGEYVEAQKGYESFLKLFPHHRQERDAMFALGWVYQIGRAHV